jgi:hypothetical protein
MTNLGIAPPDYSSLVGEFRLMYGDITYAPLDPDEPGFGNYEKLSDAEIEMLLASSSDSVSRSIAMQYYRLAGEAAKQSKVVKDYDLQVDLTKRSDALLEVAKVWEAKADSEDDAAGLTDIFEISPLNSARHYHGVEAAPWVYPYVRL